MFFLCIGPKSQANGSSKDCPTITVGKLQFATANKGEKKAFQDSHINNYSKV